jgi:hypothetical protein
MHELNEQEFHENAVRETIEILKEARAKLAFIDQESTRLTTGSVLSWLTHTIGNLNARIGVVEGTGAMRTTEAEPLTHIMGRRIEITKEELL